jgi:hypothetical protein
VSGSKVRARERRQKVEAMRAQERRAERRRNWLIIGTALVIAVAILVPTVIVVVGQQRRQAAVESAAQEPIKGVQSFSNLSRQHVNGPVNYPQTPPVGGEHNPVWANCGVYSQPIQPAQGVHSLEHGAVWITYRPGLPSDQLDIVTQLAEDNTFVLVSPFQDLPSPVVASAWGKQLRLDDAGDERLPVFVRKYVQGPQTPEPGAPCTGGVGSPS